jgi:Tol biopolymer transport system component
MSKKIILHVSVLLLAFCSCKTIFKTTGPGENFNALTRITEPGTIYAAPRGGDNGGDLVFVGYQNKTPNVFFKEKVLSTAITQKTNGENGCYTPDYCLATGNIAFAYLVGGNFDVCSINSKSGKAMSKIVNSNDNEFNPSWSSDGNYLTYETGIPHCAYAGISFGGLPVTADRLISNQIWVKNLKTNEVKMLGKGNYPKFSPDGKLIAFVKLEKIKGGVAGSICTMTPEGENVNQLTDMNLGFPSSPSWNPDGKYLVFSLTKLKEKYVNIYTVGTNGENLKQFTQYANNLTPYWSNENLIYFTSDRGSQKFKYSIWRFKSE